MFEGEGDSKTLTDKAKVFIESLRLSRERITKWFDVDKDIAVKLANPKMNPAQTKQLQQANKVGAVTGTILAGVQTGVIYSDSTGWAASMLPWTVPMEALIWIPLLAFSRPRTEDIYWLP